MPQFNPQWRLQKVYGGGFLADWGPHLIEQCLDLTGAWPEGVTCQLRSQLWATKVEDYSTAVLHDSEFVDGGRISLITVVWGCVHFWQPEDTMADDSDH